MPAHRRAPSIDLLAGLLVALAVWLALVASSAMASDCANWQVDTTQNCKVCVQRANDEAIRWSGQCVGGYASGDGTILWVKGGDPNWSLVISNQTGLNVANGIVRIKAEAIKFDVFYGTNDYDLSDRCELFDRIISKSYPPIAVHVQPGTDLAHLFIVNHIASLVTAKAKKDCPPVQSQDSSNQVLRLHIFQQSSGYNAKNPPSLSAIHDGLKCSHGANDSKMCSDEYSNPFFLRRKQHWDQQREVRQQKEREQQAAFERERAQRAEQMTSDAARTIYEKFISDNKIEIWPSGSSLYANPFAHQGKVIACVGRFEQMLTADSAMVLCESHPVVISGIPRTVFTSGQVPIVFAGKVSGNTSIKLGPMDVKAPLLAHRAVHLCRDPQCTDMLAWKNQRTGSTEGQSPRPRMSDTPKTPSECPAEPGHRSIEGKISTSMTFINETTQLIRLHWLNYKGDRQFYADVQPGRRHVQQTYVTHPWVITDSTGHCLGVYLPDQMPRSISIR